MVHALRVLRIGQADTVHSTVLHVPSLAAVVTGDLAYNQVHMMTAETGEPERAQWIANLDAVAELEPAVVVAGHKQVDNDNDPKIIAESQQYLRDFTRIAAEDITTAGIIARMTERYPDWENLRTLWHSARTAITRKSCSAREAYSLRRSRILVTSSAQPQLRVIPAPP